MPLSPHATRLKTPLPLPSSANQIARMRNDHEAELDAFRKSLEKEAKREEREKFSMQANVRYTARPVEPHTPCAQTRALAHALLPRQPKASSREHYYKHFPVSSHGVRRMCGGPASVSTRLRRPPPVFALSVAWGERPPSQADMRPLLQLLAQDVVDLSKVYHQVDFPVR